MERYKDRSSYCAVLHNPNHVKLLKVHARKCLDCLDVEVWSPSGRKRILSKVIGLSCFHS